MKRESPKNYPTFLRLADESLHNAYGLLADSILLFRDDSWPTSTSLSILALEELGKFFILHHLSMESVQFESKAEREEFLRPVFSGGMVFRHRLKQEWALVEAGIKITKWNQPQYLDKLKQQGFYVGFEKGKTKAPSRIKKSTAYRHIKQVGKVFSSLRNFPFSGWLEGPGTDLNHQEIIAEVEEEIKILKSEQGEAGNG